MLNSKLGKLQFWIMFIGFHTMFLVQHLIGVQGMPRRVTDYPSPPGDAGTDGSSRS